MIAIGIVVSRYGPDVAGGAETLARQVAERMVRQGARVTVFTTCARGPLSRCEDQPGGESLLKGVRIKRFPVAGDLGPVPGDRKKRCSASPPSSPDLVQGLIAGQEQVDLFLFFSAAGFLAEAGIRALSKPVILFPIVREEPPLLPPAAAEVWRRPRALFFLTGAEMELVRRRFAPPGKLRLVRTGVDSGVAVDEQPFRRRFQLIAPYLLYAGACEAGRGLEDVFAYYQALKREAYVDLVLIGQKRMDLPVIQGLKYLGFVSAEDARAAFRGALLSLQPSPRQSLALATLESFALGTPALVNRRCPVLLEHVEASGAGLAYESETEFMDGFRRLYRRPALRQKMAAKGQAYVQRLYSWEAVMREIQAGIAEVLEIKKMSDVRR